MQVHPGRGLGFLTLGASLHDVLTRFKAQNHVYPVIDLSFSPSEPLVNPVILNLPSNGFRLRFDGPDQRLRLIEVLDFTKRLLNYKETEIVKLPEKARPQSEYPLSGPSGPTFRHVYNKLFGPTFPGEYQPPLSSGSVSENGLYVLSYPGVAFTFPLQNSAWKPNVDFVSQLSSHAAAATSMAIFDGQSWPEVRQDLMVRDCMNPRSLALSSRGKELRPDEIELIRIHGNGKVDLERRNSPDFHIVLSETTAQDLIAELGPPDAIHRKYDRRLSIHKNQHRQQKTRRTFSNDFAANQEDLTDTDQSSKHTITDESDVDDETQLNNNSRASLSAECFYNYFQHGFDVFISYPTFPSLVRPSAVPVADRQIDEGSMNQLVATKIILHANVPGSYPFNRYRRSRWVIDALDLEQDVVLNSETLFASLSDSLQRIWHDEFANGSSKDSAQKAMVLNRDWGDSPGSSCEILGTWEETTADSQKKETNGPNANGSPGFGNTKLYGFPGLLFEVLENDATLHLPKSAFPARAKAKDRPEYIKRCTDDLYAWQRARKLPQRFTLHDGPPYANGALHIGHALNKILKDVICRSRLSDHVVDWRPGWDCHGLPIELKALQQQGERATSDAVGIRAAARKLAVNTVQDHKQAFRRWGIMADWDNAWTTMDKDFEIKQLEVFQVMARKGLLYRRFKPVYWSPSTRTALAEAELEYRDDHVSTAAFVMYPLHTLPDALAEKLEGKGRHISAVIWTTTPWTLPANKAIGIHSDIEYTVASCSSYGWLLVASSRLAEVEHHLNEPLEALASFEGEELLGTTYTDPGFGGRSPPRSLLHANFVSETSGSGLVQFAPGHGMDEYLLCLEHDITAFAPLDDEGCYTALAYPDEPESLLGKEVLGTGTQAVLQLLSEHGQLLGQHEYIHNYPYDWRSKKPVIVRATEQWFANVGTIQEDALAALESVKFIPSSSMSRLRAFVKNRSEWCISRQRAWGVPIPALYDIETNEALLSDESISHIIQVIRERGMNAWWTDDELDPTWTPENLRKCDGKTPYRRGKDTMDVWFDSGTSWTQTEQMSEKDRHVADCYIEGTDQHRGWFQSSLLTHVAHQSNNSMKGDPPKAPYKNLITHGFTLDQDGRKMSKSVGNVISPDEIMEGTLLPITKRKIDGKMADIRDTMGPDALRLWVASCDYTSDVKVSQVMLQAVNGKLSKYRVTFKLILGILGDFHPDSHVLINRTHIPETPSLGTVHQIALWRLTTVTSNVQAYYNSFEFSKAVIEINKYIINDLSSGYFEWIKDAAYCGTTEQRLQVHTTLYQIFNNLQQMLLPITPLLIEEVWDYTPQQIKDYEEQKPPAQRPKLQPRWDEIISDQLKSDIPHLMEVLATVKSTQELARLEKKMGDSLQSYVAFESQATEIRDLFERYDTAQLEALFGVSGVKITSDTALLPNLQRAEWAYDGQLELLGQKVKVWVYEPQLAKCIRCWRYAAPVEADEGTALCGRCEWVIEDLKETKPELFV